MRVISPLITPFFAPLCFLLFLFNAGKLSGQDSESLRQWLSNSKVQLEQAFDQSIRNEKFRPGWVEKMEIRTETDEFELNRQEYMLRFTPSTPGIRKAQKNLIKLNNQEASLYVSELRSELMKLLLADFLDIYDLSKQQALHAQLKLILDDQHTVTQRMIRQVDFNPKKLLEIEEDQHKLRLDQFENEAKLNRLLENRKSPDFNQLIQVEEISTLISQLILKEKSLEEDEKYMLEKEILDAEIRMEKAEKNRIIDFVQARYSGPHDDIFNERVSVGLGLELPFSGSTKTKMEQLRVEKWKLEQEANMQLQLESFELDKAAEELLLTIQKWKFSKQMLTQSIREFQQLEESSTESEWKSPELLLYKKAQQVERQLDLLSVEKDIYEMYFDILQLVGLTGDDSYIDYLIKN